MEQVQVSVTVNGTRYVRDVEPRLLLSDFIRHGLFTDPDAPLS